jgi:hypothetical protein
LSRAAQSLAPTRNAAAWGLGAVVILFGFTLCRRGLILSDEGYLLLQALDITNGKVLYRDMDAFVAPGVWFLLAGLFEIVEPSVLASRLVALVCYAATVWVSVRIVRQLTDRRFAWATVGAFLLLTVWAFPAWTWSFYSPYAVLFALAALERLLAWRATARGFDLVWTGVWLGLSIAFKQNYGVLALAGAAIAVAAIRLEARSASPALLRELSTAGLRVAAGVVAVLLPCVAYFVYHGALPHAFEALVLHPFGGFLGQHDIPYLPLSEFFQRDHMAGLGRLTYGAFALTNTALRFNWHPYLVRGVELLHVLMYWIPPVFFAAAAWLVLRPLRRGRSLDAGLASALAVGGLLFLGVFPRADYNHLVNVYQPVLVVAVVVIHRLVGLRAAIPPLAARLALGVGGLLLACYALVAAYWYVDLLGSLSEEIPQRRGGVLVSLESKQMLEFEVDAIRAATRPGEAVLTLPGLAMLNFLAERPMPSRYYNLYAVHIAHDQGAGVVEGAEANRVRLVVADYHDFFSETVGLREYAPRLTRYLRRFFTPAFSVAVDEHLFLRRRPKPLPDRATRNVLGDCDVGPFDWSVRSTLDQLLFQTLYHPHRTAEKRVLPQASTLCRVRVPAGAQLAFGAGHRQPSRVSPATSLTAEIWVQRLAAPEEAPLAVYREVFHPSAASGWGSPPPVERRVDLSRWAGEEVLLIFRTLYRGDVRMNVLDFKGFVAVWRDPQLEFEDDTR